MAGGITRGTTEGNNYVLEDDGHGNLALTTVTGIGRGVRWAIVVQRSGDVTLTGVNVRPQEESADGIGVFPRGDSSVELVTL